MALIEREAALEICEKEYQKRLRMLDYCGDTVAWDIGNAIKALPTIDPIHAAGGCYCRECKWYEDTGVCGWTSTDSTKNLRDIDDFCSDGEPNMSDPPKEEIHEAP